MSTTVQQILSTEPATLDRDATIDEALAEFIRRGLTEAYVTSCNGHLLGLLPDYELLKARLAGVPGSDCVQTLISCNPVTVSPETSVEEIALLFRHGRSQSVAVVDNGYLRGCISRTDVLRIMAARGGARASEAETADTPVRAEPSPSASLRGPRSLAQVREAVDG